MERARTGQAESSREEKKIENKKIVIAVTRLNSSKHQTPTNKQASKQTRCAKSFTSKGVSDWRCFFCKTEQGNADSGACL
mmetsp:Transcript_6558/g.11567  ORF Transcript_6558/g.11567 Transcript_6558/m.11567 type:complete len:80 (+) Transcript_6558:802-1041(+)